MENTTLEEQLEKLEKDLAQQREALAKEMNSRNREGFDLTPVIANNEIRIEALKTAIKNRDAAAAERERYINSPDYAKEQKRIEQLTKELDSLNEKYCAAGLDLLEKITAMHSLDEELYNLKRKAGPCNKLMGKGVFSPLASLENALANFARDRKMFNGMRRIFQARTR